jgi:hypothetical protein
MDPWFDSSGARVYPWADNSSHNPFVSTNAFIEYGRYPTGEDYSQRQLYSGDDVKWEITSYDQRRWDVRKVMLYRETWIYTGGGQGDTNAFFPEDARIVSPEEMRRINNSLGRSNLRCKNQVKLYQLLGGGWTGINDFVMFEDLPLAATLHLADYFDGIGIEGKVTDYPARQDVLSNVAKIAKWTGEKGMECLVWIDGYPLWMTTPSRAQRTYHSLWRKMLNENVDYRSPHIVYFRQGGWSRGVHTPESGNSLTRQQSWLINVLKQNQTSMFVSPLPPQRVLKNTVFCVPLAIGAELSATNLPLSVTAVSSNTQLFSNEKLQINGTGIDRVLQMIPVVNATGEATITVTVTDGVRSQSTSFDVDVVSESSTVTAVADGHLNDFSTWNTAVPAGDLSETNHFRMPHPMAPDMIVWLNLAAAAEKSVWKITGGTVTVSTNAFGTNLVNSVPFFGETLEVSGNGILRPVGGAHLAARNLSLHDGGLIYAGELAGKSFKIRMLDHRLLLNGGALKSGNASGADLYLDECFLDGSGKHSSK